MFGPPASAALLDLVSDPVLTLRADLSALRANPAAREWLGADAAEGWRLLRHAAGMRLEAWLRDAVIALDSGRQPPPAPPLKLADGQRATLQLVRDRPNWLLHARLSPADPGEPPLVEWLALSPLPAVLADASGALLRRNAAFDALSPGSPRHLNDLPDLLQALLGWHHGAPLAALAAQRLQDPPLVTEAEFVDPQGRQRWLQARLRLWRHHGRSLLLAILEDHSTLHERDLAHQQLEALMDTAAVGLATFQPEAGWLKAHRKGSPFKTGAKQSIGSLQGIHREIVEPGSLPEFERLQRALKKGDPVEVRYAVRHPELGRRWLLTRVTPGQLAGGRRTTSVVTLDVTAQAQAENALLLRAESERTVLDSVLVGIVTVGPEGIEWMNRSARRMFGCELDDVRGQPMGVLAPEGESEHPFHRAEPSHDVFECRLRGRDGREFWVIGNAVQTPREDGPGLVTQQLTYALLDIDRRRQAEAQSRQAQASLARIIEAAPLAISLHEAQSLRIVKLNQTAATMAGRSEAQLLGGSPAALFGAEQGEQVAADMREALASLTVVQREYRVPTGQTARMWDTRLLHLAGVSGDDAPELLLLVASDVTEQRAAEQARLQAAISQRELLVREVHHRIKNNLQGVAGLLQQIAARRPEVAPVLREAVGQVQAIAQVYGLQVGASGPLVLKRVFDAIVGSVQRQQGRITTTAAEGGALMADWCLPEAEAIPIALSLNELLGNALKHSDGAQVRCQLLCDLTGVTVEIVNPGRLPEGFALQNIRSGVSGLGLVRALLPRRSAILSLEQHHENVVCRLELIPPSVVHNPATKASS
ncbi:PAS domain-containing protein [Roseateles cellulosilyticus]|uniref:histidine kinase n=1 Tax=Pelomonas cellulosilytica TaxID=2906762 RepID=A0ABS8XZJ5_9BURK|nr:PAS domain-containing protein [Pelomonas sp. P8]MCE4554820.1 PAS domain-containing protein [Pelomonas sp. P8]